MARSTTDVAALRAALEKRFSGELIDPAHASYDAKRVVWNGMIDRRPAVIARPASTADVAAAVAVARDAGVPLALRAGGHNVAGQSTCDDGIVLDLTSLNSVSVDPATQTARVGGGALISELDVATQQHGLAVPMGTVSHTGVAGLTLGGGLGRLMRLHGLSIDNLISAEVVTADGRVVRASADENAELFWGLRGAGSNFGVVTEFEFRAHAVGTDLGAAIFLFELDHAFAALRALGALSSEAQDDLLVIGGLMTVPAGPPFPPPFHGRKMLMVAANHFGPPDADEAAFKPIADLAPPSFNASLRMPFLVAQQLNDERYRWGKRYYEKGNLLRALDDNAIDAALTGFESVPNAESEIVFLPLGGAAGRVAEDATAYSGRSATHFMGVLGAWEDPSEDDRIRDWIRATHGAARPAFVGANYVNSTEPGDDLAAVYGAEKLARLRALKRTWDPDNVFRLNANIAP